MEGSQVSSRDAILGALGDTRLAAAPTAPGGPVFRGLLEDTFVAVGGDLLTPGDLAALHGKTAVAEAGVPASVLEGFKLVEDVWTADVGISIAVAAIAETGSVVMAAGPGKPRLASLAPPHNIVVVRRSTIVPTLEAAFANLPKETTAIITGPSRTADIEGTLVRGIHGPKRLSLLLID